MARRQVRAQLFASLDLVVESPEQWHFPWVVPELVAAVAHEHNSAGTLLLGRITYESFAGSWPKRGDDVPLATRLNTMEKVVVSSTLAEPTWHNTSALDPGDDVVAAVDQLASTPGGPITIAGSLSLVDTLLEHGRLDRLQLLVHPHIRGGGRTPFDRASERTVHLAEAYTVGDGVQLLEYDTTHH